jgi:hypothetical protein
VFDEIDIVVIEVQKKRPEVKIPEVVEAMKIGADRIGDSKEFRDAYE